MGRRLVSELADALRARLGDPEPEVRRVAAQEIPRLAAPDSCDLLVVALADEDWRVRKEAASVAARVEPRTAVVFAVARALGERDQIGLRNAAVEALVGIGPDAVPGAIDALGRLDADGRKLAVEVLSGAPTLGGMRALARALSDDDANVVVAAAEGLGRAHLAGEEARELARGALVRLLRSGDTPTKLAALDALRALGSEVPWSELEVLVGEPHLRRQALAAAGGSQFPRAVRALAEACADPSGAVARDALVALGRTMEVAWDDEQLLDVVAKTLLASERARTRLRELARSTDDDEARGAALLALGLVRDPDDITVIADGLADDPISAQAEAALRRFGGDAITRVLAAGRTAAPSLRGATISMIPQLAPRAAEPLAAMREALSERVPEVAVPALKSVGIVGGAEDLAPIAKLVGNDEPKIAAAAEAALHAVASRHPKAARALLTGKNPRGEEALAATILLDALASVDASESRDLTFLGIALTHRDARVRRSAIDALVAFGRVAKQGPDPSEAITLTLADEEPAVATAAIRALGRLGRGEQLATLAATTRDPLRLATVLRALRDADPARAFAAARPLTKANEAAVASAAVEVVGSTSFDGRVEALMDATEHAEHEVVKLALGQLLETKDERAMVSLARAVEHPAETVRRYAAELLGQVGAEGEALLRARLDREPSPEVRDAIMMALATKSQSP